MKIIIGLGNPGEKYEKNRHNVGFTVLSALQEDLEFPDFQFKEKFQASVSEGTVDGEKILLVKPQTFMNKSGEAVRSVKDFYKISDPDIWAVYDDVDLPLGTLRVRETGSGGTHNGMNSVISCLGTEDFPRFRIGVENRSDVLMGKQDLSSYVLQDFSEEEEKVLREIVKKTILSIQHALENGISVETV